MYKEKLTAECEGRVWVAPPFVASNIAESEKKRPLSNQEQTEEYFAVWDFLKP